jgi:hypothetical protein
VSSRGAILLAYIGAALLIDGFLTWLLIRMLS